MFAVQSLERPSGSRRSEEEEEEEDVGSHQEEVSSRGDAPQTPDRPHTRADVAMQTAVPEACSPKSQHYMRVEDWDGETREQLNRRTMVLIVLYLVRVAEGQRSFL
jgi:hypothetical protein